MTWSGASLPEPGQPSGDRPTAGDDALSAVALRLAVETEAARVLARDSKPLTVLVQPLEMMEVSIDRRDRDRLADAELRFHSSLVELADDEFLSAGYRTMRPRLERMLRGDGRLLLSLTGVAEQHRALMEAIQTKDPELAARAMRAHILNEEDSRWTSDPWLDAVGVARRAACGRVSRAELDVIIAPERVIEVSVAVGDDQGGSTIYQGWRVQHDLSRGPGKGGMRFHPAAS
jgi:hypothetical protein